MRATLAILAAATALAGCGGGSEPPRADRSGLDGVVEADLDGDGNPDVSGVVRDSGEPVARFDCGEAGRAVRLLDGDGLVEAIELLETGGDRPVVLVTAREGASGGAVTARAVRFSACGRPDELFAYPSDLVSLPASAEMIADAEVRADGADIVVTERFTRRGEPVCCPSIQRTSTFALSEDGYEREGSEVSRLPTAPRDR